MYYDALRTFVTVVEEGNFTRAAEKRLISQPSVSVHIQNLEKEFQTSLFVRSPKQLQLTSTGELLYERAKQIIQIYESTKEEIIAHHQSLTLELKIGASFTIGEYVLPSLLEELGKIYPEIKLEVIIGNTEEIIEHVKLFHVDIGLIEGQSNDKSLEVFPFMIDELKVVASPNHPLSSQKGATIEELQNQTWITREKGSGTRAYLEHVLRSHGLKTKNVISISSTQGVKEAVIRGLGFSLISKFAIAREIESQYLSIIPLKDASFLRRFSYATSRFVSKQKELEEFINLLKNNWVK
ncbi:LysR family transcriptional regulator [Neobacillus ginsengisoli]|uniref:DNA-binding transcriptional LysR family regulator n=1 Tax=Neobacillus ginsengisoli TaxID=904295 RepID=A0ABT9XYG4_9BACI|nr:LysR family transcriptional regulator [Neobacillus ginsengisoli]MDQ0200612.1 DNA-binding transcriptional LysR family regulator [Neobacillus ginsengisoli]